MNALRNLLARVLLAVAVWTVGSVELRAQYLLVNGQLSDNVVQIDLATGQSQVYGTYDPGDAPRNLAIDSSGQVYSSLNGGDHNIVKLVPQGTTHVAQAFTGTLSSLGAGQMAFYQGNLYAATDSGRTIDRIDATGSVTESFSVSNSFNLRAMAISGSNLYYAEYFQNSLVVENLTQTPPADSILGTDNVNLAEPDNMTIGADGNLIIASVESPLIQEFSASTGQFVGTLANMAAFNSSITGTWDVEYNAALNNYFVTVDGAPNSVFRLSASGQLLNTYSSDLLQDATGIAVVAPEPCSLMLAIVVLGCLAAVAIRRRHTVKNAFDRA